MELCTVQDCEQKHKSDTKDVSNRSIGPVPINCNCKWITETSFPCPLLFLIAYSTLFFLSTRLTFSDVRSQLPMFYTLFRHPHLRLQASPSKPTFRCCFQHARIRPTFNFHEGTLHNIRNRCTNVGSQETTQYETRLQRDLFMVLFSSSTAPSPFCTKHKIKSFDAQHRLHFHSSLMTLQN